MPDHVRSQSGAEESAFAAFEAWSGQAQFGSNALLLFVAQMRLQIDDIDAFASNALTDGNNDKKCDLVAVVADGTKVVVAQGYFAKDSSRQGAPANKASDANTAVSWLLSGDLDQLPESLRGAAEEVRTALNSGEVSQLEIWYVHNLAESNNVMAELGQAARTADQLIKANYPNAGVDVTAFEIGRRAVGEEYSRTQHPIIVRDSFTFKIPGGFAISASEWQAYCTAIKASDLRLLWSEHQTRLMAPNIRDYLGVRRSSGNINHGIKETAQIEPENFVVFNNGITVLVNDFHVNEDGTEVVADGIGIVNGGQTTGAIGELSDEAAEGLEDALVMARFVKSTDEAVLGDIVKYNNTQNKVQAADFRSKTPIQDRLRQEFELIPNAEYRGGRRGGSKDAITRSRTLLPDSSVAQSLAAFHGDPNLAYNNTRQIWESDQTYSHVFRDTLTARHIVYVLSLLRSVDGAKFEIMGVDESERTEAQRRHAEFFRGRGSNYLLVAAIGSCIETLIARHVSDSYSLGFGASVSPDEAEAIWDPVVSTVLSFSHLLVPATDQGLKTKQKVKDALQNFASMIEATRTANPQPFNDLGQATKEIEYSSLQQHQAGVGRRDPSL